MSTHDKLCTNKTWKLKAHFSPIYRINKVVGIAKPSAKIYIAIFYCTGYPRQDNERHSPIVEIWGVQVGESDCICRHRLGEGAAQAAPAHPCGAPAPASASVHGVCGKGGRIRASRILAHSTRSVPNRIWNPLTTQRNVLTKPLPNHAVSWEFWQSTICRCSIPELCTHYLQFWFAINHTKLCTID